MNQNNESVLEIYGKKILGGILIITGIMGLFLPFLQGVVMIVGGLILLGNKKLAIKVRAWIENVKAFTKKIFRRNK